MRLKPALIYHSAHRHSLPDIVREFAHEAGLEVLRPTAAADVAVQVQRRAPECVILDTADAPESAELCRILKQDVFSSIVPVVFLGDAHDPTGILAALSAGADEVLGQGMTVEEQLLRLRMMLRRASRDVSVNPTTRLPGTVQIERDIGERMRRDEVFAVCYADLDHFKEFNDRYGYNEGDRVILVLSRILRDIVMAHAPTGFVGHIGGDDFIFNVPLERMKVCCEEVIEVFDELIPFQYTAKDRAAGHFVGADRRGNRFRVPLMTVSIGVVTNRRRRFTHTAKVSELATEMKSYAKTLPGSVYAVDRRKDHSGPDATSERETGARKPLKSPISS